MNIFSEGEWRPRAIATLGNGASPSAESVLVVSSGFEGANTLRLVNALEPDRIMVGLSVGGNIEHEKLSKRNNARLGEQYQLAADVLEFPSINLARSLAVLKDATMNVTRPVHRDLALSFLICGSKLDALAIGLFALDNDVAQIYFSDPERRLETTASAVSWVTAVKVRS
ncbi:hypothetical protein [Curtobacterium flaccumfaciens]|uniref:hypothetical protein n=1 Tax=Curtobacterium flaccumfaciens TaxID=2035 RepID=UPI001BDF5FB9|nr:hypothetical protein [Curtobacterium flaccumfaciens]MBT1684249.1 hypothetical protein [Curtobacterium flaccumfaciens pv. flaccumfaciens]